jgi:hypothetical protein
MEQTMSVVRIFGVGMGLTAVLTAATACGGGEKASPSSTSSSSTASSTSTTSSSAAAQTTSGAPPSGSAPLTDYTYLLIPASDVGSDATTTGAPMQNPGGVAGAAVTFAGPDRTRTIDDLVVVFLDPADAAQGAKDHAASFSKYVTTAPQPFDLGTNGLIAVGQSPDNSKAVTYVTFAEGKVIVDLEFDSAPNDPAPPDTVVDIARKQDALVKNRQPA